MIARHAQYWTYRFSLDSIEYTRRTLRVYSHAIVLYSDQRHAGAGVDERCAPYVAEVRYSGSVARAMEHQRTWHGCKTVLVPLTQPDGTSAAWTYPPQAAEEA